MKCKQKTLYELPTVERIAMALRRQSVLVCCPHTRGVFLVCLFELVKEDYSDTFTIAHSVLLSTLFENKANGICLGERYQYVGLVYVCK